LLWIEAGLTPFARKPYWMHQGACVPSKQIDCLDLRCYCLANQGNFSMINRALKAPFMNPFFNFSPHKITPATTKCLLSSTCKLAIVCVLLVALCASGQNYTIIHAFSEPGDGSYPKGVMMKGSDHALYGTCEGDGLYGGGTVFKLDPAHGYSVIYNLTTADG